jgi:Ca2+/Na+ antiporter
MNIRDEFMKNIFLIFVIIFFIYYNIVINRDSKGIFFILITLFILYILYSQKAALSEKKNNNIITYINNLEKELNNDYEVPENKIFFIHKTPRNIKYIKKTKDVQQIIYDIKFLKVFDNALYQKIITYLEYFLKIHYKVVIGKYDFELYFPILKDIRNEILNSMKTIYFNIPTISTTIDIKNLDKYTEQRILKIQSITLKYLKIIFHKYKKNHLSYEAPFEYDTLKDPHYNLF